MNQKRAKIAFEDGRIFTGLSFGADGQKDGEVVFNTSMAGYQEIITDPSYKGQIVTMTYPLIGNYGINPEDCESRMPFIEGLIIKENSRIASNWRSKQTLEEYLKENGIIGIEGVDTRAITRHIRLQGAMKAVISTDDTDDKTLIKKAKASPGLVGRDLVREVTCDKKYEWNNQKPVDSGQWTVDSEKKKREKRYKVVVLDCGVKYNILRILSEMDCNVTVVPASTSADEILKDNPDGIMLSNGPGDPAAVPYVVDTVKGLLGKLPIFGICLGQQMLGQALGGKTYKLKFGHHGGNQPVKDLKTNKIAITVQNHGFCVDIDTLEKDDIEITHMNLNDNTLEGIRHRKLPAFSVQFHPESSPGPHDAEYLFKEFIGMMNSRNDK
ncbi:MAG: glutamine-hydrolyzing carbamoyl-phosphate synthase small subunit [Candidatus Omnitrophota bacterium]